MSNSAFLNMCSSFDSMSKPGRWPVDPYEILKQLDKILSHSQAIRIQQVQLSAEVGDSSDRMNKADTHWNKLNKVHKELTEAIKQALEE